MGMIRAEKLVFEYDKRDEEGNVIVWPGQIIGKEEVKAALRSGKLQDLLDLATVSLLEDHEPTVVAEQAAADEEDDDEIEVEIIAAEPETSEEDEAFIAEEAAKIEEAEEQKDAE